MDDFPEHRITSAMKVALLIATLLAVVSSCSTARFTGASRQKPGIFRSDDFIVYRIARHETPALLAERFLGDSGKGWIIEEANAGLDFENGSYAVIPLKEGNRGGIYKNGYQTVPILCYHRFGDKVPSPLSLPPDIFESQMNYLSRNGYRTITPDDLLAFLEYRRRIPAKSVLITIDDGYGSAYDIAYPILRKYGFTATLFIYTDYIGVSKSALTWAKLKEMKAAGFSVGSHTVSHADLTLRREGESEASESYRIERELALSKRIIDGKLGQDTLFISFPYGRYNRDVLRLAKKTGYKLAASVKRGGNPFFSDPYTLHRDQILKRDLSSFIARLKTFNRVSLK